MSERLSLRALGWTDERAQELEDHDLKQYPPARVAAVHRGACSALSEQGEISARVPARLYRIGAGPAVGDWIAVEEIAGEHFVRGILPRRSVFSRKVAGDETEEQVVVANADRVLLVSALGADFNLRRIERYLTTAFSSGATPVIVLTKADLDPQADLRALEAGAVAPGVDVVVTSVVNGRGIDALRDLAAPGITLALLGSSGTGKSTLVNLLAGGEIQRVEAVRADGKGRHTTTHRRLIVLPSGGLVVDTPGMRELQLWDADEGLDAAFDDVADLASGCRFSDCAHESEPGCAVREAVAAGALDGGRLDSYRKLQRELAFLERKKDRRAQAEETRKWRSVARAMRNRPR
ncbi:MAG TPA: ribosome small subunit-dependent GTPase A [Actinomycetota bacterium]|nr:ribosome small subunit-dependent GTPase A [Actinomycetota bacterium]